jgi:L-iditol 2-dehydrogenase
MMTQAGTMKALLLTDYHRLELVEQPIPKLEADDEVILQVKSVGVCGSDLHGYTGHTGRRIPPLVMGHEVAGVIVEAGANAHVAPGTRVATMTVAACGICAQCQAGRRSLCVNRKIMGMNAPGGYAEFVRWRSSSIISLPDTLSFEHAALAEPLAVALHGVALAFIRPYDTAFIVGAGPIGLLTLAVLRQTAVSRIFVSDMSDARLEQARHMGADIVINPSRQDVRAVVEAAVPGGVDVAFEAVGVSAAAQQSLDVTRSKGQVIWLGNSQRNIQIDMQAIVTRELSVIGSYGMSEDEFRRALQMLADGRIPAETIINRRASLSEGPRLFDELLVSQETIKCVINF